MRQKLTIDSLEPLNWLTGLHQEKAAVSGIRCDSNFESARPMISAALVHNENPAVAQFGLRCLARSLSGTPMSPLFDGYFPTLLYELMEYRNRRHAVVFNPPSGQFELAAEMLKALGDSHRLKVMLRLARGEMSVTELAKWDEEKITTTSARLKVLLTARLVKRRRKRTDNFLFDCRYARSEPRGQRDRACLRGVAYTQLSERKEVMMTNHVHVNHPHRHGPGCGHIRIGHGDHIDYVHDGHLHHQNGGVVEEHAIEVSAKNPTLRAGIRAYGP